MPTLTPTKPATADPTVDPDLDVAPTDPDLQASPDRPWVCIVWDDPINLMNYVTHVFMTVFGYPKAKAEKLMFDVHQVGKAVVSGGTRERMELDAARLHGFGLWATIAHDS